MVKTKQKQEKVKKKKIEFMWANQSLTIGLMSEEAYKNMVDKLDFQMQTVNTTELFRNSKIISWRNWGYDVNLFEEACKIVEALDGCIYEAILPVNKRGPMFFECPCGEFKHQQKYKYVYVTLAELIIEKNGRPPKSVVDILGG